RNGEKPFIRLHPDELQARSGSRAHLAGVIEPVSATIQPALLARGLLHVARRQEVTVFERSPMIALERSTPLAIHTPRGRTVAARIGAGVPRPGDIPLVRRRADRGELDGPDRSHA